MLSDRFKSMYRQMGLDRPAAAKLLHVSERTLHNWETGVHEIPYSAYKLLRLLSYTELPGSWSGWHIAAGRLWSPEGFGFRPEESSWWSALCRRSELFHVLFKENARLRHAADEAAQPGQKGFTGPVTRKASSRSRNAAAGSTCPVTRTFSLTSETNSRFGQVFCPAKVRYSLPKTLFAKTVQGGGHV